MIVLSAGMPKSGTGWYFNLTNDLLIAAGYQDVREIRQKFRLHSILRQHNCNIGRLTPSKLARVMLPHLLGNTFAVKTHRGPIRGLRTLMSARIIKTTYIYRDPRDVVVSVFEHGQRIRDSGETHTFARFDTIQSAILAVGRWYLAVWRAWMRCSRVSPNHVLIARYEDLVADSIGELKRLADFLSLDVSVENRRKIVAAYQGEGIEACEGILHFNRGVVGRYSSVLSSEELELCHLLFGDYLQKMGYPE